jgi:hypothetical protein
VEVVSREEVRGMDEVDKVWRVSAAITPQEGPGRLMDNPSKYVCLFCRVGFVRDRGPDDHPAWDTGLQHKCPNCGRKMCDAGRDAALPRRGDEAGWKSFGVKVLEPHIIRALVKRH